MPWGRGGIGGTGIAFPPAETGSNVTQNQVAVLQSNTQDSDPGIDLAVFGEVLQSGLAFPNAIYNTGNLDIDLTRLRFTNNSGKPFSFKISIGGQLESSSSVNSAIMAIRLNSSGGLGTGSLRKYPAGLTQGGLNISLGFQTSGAFTLADGESVWLECAKSVLGTLIFGSCLVLVEPIW